jgi:DNA-directed RNA polymerase subunit RPC12/RpoP
MNENRMVYKCNKCLKTFVKLGDSNMTFICPFCDSYNLTIVGPSVILKKLSGDKKHDEIS